jgi:multiple sugar transport system permease protein
MRTAWLALGKVGVEVIPIRLPVAVATFAIEPNRSLGDNGMLMASSVIVVLPVVLVFIALQHYFTRGIAMTGIEG